MSNPNVNYSNLDERYATSSQLTTKISAAYNTTFLPGRNIIAPACSYTQNANYGSTVAGDTFRQPFTVMQSGSDIYLVYGNWSYGGGSSPTTPITVSASIELSNNGQVVQLFSSTGATTVTIQPKATVIMGCAGVDLVAGTTIYIRTWVSVSVAGNSVPGISRAGANPNMWHYVGADQTMAAGTPSGTINDFTYWYGPIGAIAGSFAQNLPYVALMGDSISAGQGDLNAQGGWGERALQAASLAHINIASQGAQLSNNATIGWSDALFGAQRRQLMAGCTSGLIMLGTNDFGLTGMTAATMVTRLQGIAASMKTRNIQKVFACTITPRTASTDNWQTTTNQTPATGAGTEAVRQAFNTAIRTGVSGIDGFFDTALGVEVNALNQPTMNGGYWVVNGSSNYSTIDGTHPNGTGHGLIAAKVVSSVFV